MGKWCLHASLFLGNKDMFKNYKRFDIWHVQTADIGGTKPWKNNCSLIWKLFKFLMTLLAGLFEMKGCWHIGLRWAIVALWATCLAHLSRRLTRWAYRMGLEPASVHPSIHTFKHEYLQDQQTDYNQILSEASLGWGKAALGFGADQIRTLISKATDSSHRVIMGKRKSSRFLGCFWLDPFYTCR